MAADPLPARSLLLWIRHAAGLLAACAALGAVCLPAVAQQPDTSVVPVLVPEADTARVLVQPGAVSGADTAAVVAPLPASRSSLREPVTFSARDSLILDFGRGAGRSDQATLYRDATVTYGETQLEAYAIDILFDLEELRARALEVDTGFVGLPSFAQDDAPFTGLELAYNLGTERGRVLQARTTIDDGLIQAGVAKVTEDSTLYVLDGLYTTCECDIGETPSYSLRSGKMKVVDGERIYTGPIQLYLFNIPTPLWLPFGFLPAKEGRRSGPLPPQYGEDQRGFYLQGWGWYQVINEYMDLELRGGIWTKGSWQINPIFRYNRRYRYNGGLTVDYLRELSGERDDPDVALQQRASLRWNHSQTLSPTARFTANVDLTSSGYLRTVSDNYSDNVRQTVGSTVSYTKQWPVGGRSFSLSLRQNQVLATGAADLTLPRLSFSQSRRTPFKRQTRAPGEDERFYEKLTVSYTGSLTNTFNFDPLPDDTLRARGDTSAVGISWYEALVDPAKFRRATGEAIPFQARASHAIPLAATFNVSRIPVLNRRIQLNVTPNASYDEDWFLQTERRSVDSTGVLQREEVPGFFALRQFSTSLSANTTVYGLFPIAAGPYQGVRHTLRPSLSFSYQPDFFENEWWGYTRTYVDREGQMERYPIVPGVGREQQTIRFSLDNVFETRRVRADSTGREDRRTLKLFNLSAATGYNFAQDSLRLSQITLNGRTRILDKLGLNLSASYSPYARNDSTGQTIDRYVFSLRDARFARLTSFRLSGDFAVRGGQPSGRAQRLGQETGGPLPGSPAFTDNDFVFGEREPFATFDPGQNLYTDFSIPWSLNMSFTYGVDRNRLRANRTLTLNANFDFSLTPRWRLQGNTGYDFEQMEVVTTRLNIVRDFECWEMSFNWVPFGRFQQYGFDLHVKSGKLRDILRIRQPRSDLRDRFDVL